MPLGAGLSGWILPALRSVGTQVHCFAPHFVPPGSASDQPQPGCGAPAPAVVVVQTPPTPLHLACERGDVKGALSALSQAALNAQDGDGETPAMKAAKAGSIRTLELLIKAGANLEISDAHGWTVLHWTVQAGHPEIVAIVLDAAPVLLNVRDKRGLTPLHVAAWIGNRVLVQRLLDEGADLHAPTHWGETPLHMAAHFRHFGASDALLKAGADPDKEDRMKRTPRSLAAANFATNDDSSKTDNNLRQLFEKKISSSLSSVRSISVAKIEQNRDSTRLSKAEKKQLKREHMQTKWEAKKQLKKQKTRKESEIPAVPAPQGPVDPAKSEERRERKRAAAEERKLREDENPEILIDCDFHELMTPTEQSSIAVQLSHSYSTVRKIENRPMRLAFCGVHAELLARLEKNSGFDKWNLKILPHTLEQDPRPNSNFIYLSADAEEELDLERLTKDDVLVIGGFVDRNRHKGLTFKKAQSLGVRTAKLPLGNFLHLIGSQVLTVNHVVDIVATAVDTRDWEVAVKKVVPERKRG